MGDRGAGLNAGGKSCRPSAEGAALLFYLSTYALERVRTAKLAQRAEGRMPEVKEKCPRENDTPSGDFRTSGNCSRVASTPAFMTSACGGEKESASFRLGCRPVVPSHRRTGAPGRGARYLRPHSMRHCLAVTASSRAKSEASRFLRGIQRLRMSHFGQQRSVAHWISCEGSCHRESPPRSAALTHSHRN